jgi:hypothetical protein
MIEIQCISFPETFVCTYTLSHQFQHHLVGHSAWDDSSVQLIPHLSRISVTAVTLPLIIEKGFYIGLVGGMRRFDTFEKSFFLF